MSDNMSGSTTATYAIAGPMILQAGSDPATGKTFAPVGRLHDAAGPIRDVVHMIDDLDLHEMVSIAAHYGQSRFGYAVTPNVDHLIRCHEDSSFRALYRSAEFVLMDSRFISRVLRLLTGRGLRVCTGSDLTAQLLCRVVEKNDRVVILGGTPAQIEKLTAMHGLTNVRHLNPPMGFINDPLAVEQCLKFVESEAPFRFCFLAVGSPQQEMIAQSLLNRGVAKGLALCVGASLNFLTGTEKRAPLWMQKLSIEWLYRLAQDPRRMARRYLVRGPRIFAHLRRARFVLRRPSIPAG